MVLGATMTIEDGGDGVRSDVGLLYDAASTACMREMRHGLDVKFGGQG